MIISQDKSDDGPPQRPSVNDSAADRLPGAPGQSAGTAAGSEKGSGSVLPESARAPYGGRAVRPGAQAPRTAARPPAKPPGAAGPDDARTVRVVRLRCYALPVADEQTAGLRRPYEAAAVRKRLVIEQDVADVPADRVGDLSAIARLSAKAVQKPDTRDRLARATAEYVVDSIDHPAAGSVRLRWQSRDLLDPTAISSALDRVQEALPKLAQEPLIGLLTGAGAAPPLAGIAGGIGADLVSAPADRVITSASVMMDIAGILIGTVTGFHPLVVASVKHLARTEVHEVVVRGFSGVSRDFLGGAGERATRAVGRHQTGRLPAGRSRIAPSRLEARTRSPQPSDRGGIQGPGGFG